MSQNLHDKERTRIYPEGQATLALTPKLPVAHQRYRNPQKQLKPGVDHNPTLAQTLWMAP
jgi:hypothetical protein